MYLKMLRCSRETSWWQFRLNLCQVLLFLCLEDERRDLPRRHWGEGCWTFTTRSPCCLPWTWQYPNRGDENPIRRWTATSRWTGRCLPKQVFYLCTSCQLQLRTLACNMEASKDMIYVDLLLKDFYGAESWLFNDKVTKEKQKPGQMYPTLKKTTLCQYTASFTTPRCYCSYEDSGFAQWAVGRRHCRDASMVWPEGCWPSSEGLHCFITCGWPHVELDGICKERLSLQGPNWEDALRRTSAGVDVDAGALALINVG